MICFYPMLDHTDLALVDACEDASLGLLIIRFFDTSCPVKVPRGLHLSNRILKLQDTASRSHLLGFLTISRYFTSCYLRTRPAGNPSKRTLFPVAPQASQHPVALRPGLHPVALSEHEVIVAIENQGRGGTSLPPNHVTGSLEDQMMGAATHSRCGGWVVGAGLACIGRVLQLGR